MTTNYRLPIGWERIRLGDIIEPSKEKVKPQEISHVPYIGLEHIEKETGRLLGHGYSEDVRSTKSVFHPGDLLYGKLRPYLNKVYIPHFEGICSTDILVYPKSPYISNNYLYYRFLSNDFVHYANQNMSGVQHPRVSSNILADFCIEVPPNHEQKRIVVKIEELFTQLDAGVAELQKAKAQLKRYRQSVLKAAVEGELTREWREAHQDELEPASELLERILEERRERWEEEELAKMRAKGKEPKDEKWKTKYKKPATPETDRLPQFPEGCVWVTMEQVSDPTRPITYGILKPGPFISDGVPMLRILDIKNGRIDILNVHKVSQELSNQYQRTLLQGDECLISLVGSIGLSVYVPDSIAGANIHRNLGMITTLEVMNSKYLNVCLASPVVQSQIRDFVTGANQPLFNLGDLKKTSIPLRSIKEQTIINSEVERRLSVADEIERQLYQALEQSERLRQSILKQAFEGKLVPQDPSDDPASNILKEIYKNKK